MKLTLFILLSSATLLVAQKEVDVQWNETLKRAHSHSQVDLEYALSVVDSLLNTDILAVHDTTFAQLKKQRGAYLCRSGQIDKGLEEFEDAKLLFKVNDMNVDVSDCWFNIASGRLYKGELDKAIEGYLKTLKYSAPFEDTTLVAQCYSHLSNALNMAGEVEEAEKFLKKAEAIATEDRNIAYINSMKAIFAYQKGDNAAAEKQYRALISTLDQNSDPQRFAIELANLVAVLEPSQERDQMVHTIDSTFVDNPNDYAEMLASPILFNHFREMENPDQAMVWYYKGVELAKRLHSFSDLGQLHLKLAEVRMEENQFSDAVTLLDMAKERLIQSNTFGEAERAFELSVKAHSALGDSAASKIAQGLLDDLRNERSIAKMDRKILMDMFLSADTPVEAFSPPAEEEKEEEAVNPFVVVCVISVLAMAIGWFFIRPKRRSPINLSSLSSRDRAYSGVDNGPSRCLRLID